jgi:hypothetical protein
MYSARIFKPVPFAFSVSIRRCVHSFDWLLTKNSKFTGKRPKQTLIISKLQKYMNSTGCWACLSRYGSYITSYFKSYFFHLALQTKLGLGRLHKTSRFISITVSRTVGSTPWTGDQLVAHKHVKTHTQHKHQTSMPEAGFESATTASERAKIALRPLRYRDRHSHTISMYTEYSRGNLVHAIVDGIY